jgi:hypothetical protein
LASPNPDGCSFIFIDRDQEDDALSNYVEACEPYTARNSATVFHDLGSPHMTNAALCIESPGRVFRTARIVAVAGHENVSPIVHRPESRIERLIPDRAMPPSARPVSNRPKDPVAGGPVAGGLLNATQASRR